ncbi:MAG: hypothetical protein ABEJ74_08460 [Haloferacaceae archaeon]
MHTLSLLLGLGGAAVGYAVGGVDAAVFGACVGFFLGQTVRSLRHTVA